MKRAAQILRTPPASKKARLKPAEVSEEEEDDSSQEMAKVEDCSQLHTQDELQAITKSENMLVRVCVASHFQSLNLFSRVKPKLGSLIRSLSSTLCATRDWTYPSVPMSTLSWAGMEVSSLFGLHFYPSVLNDSVYCLMFVRSGYASQWTLR